MEVRRTYEPVAAGAPAAQPGGEPPVEPPPVEASAKGDDEAKKGLPTPETDPLTLPPKKDPLTLAPQKKGEAEKVQLRTFKGSLLENTALGMAENATWPP